MSIYDYIIIIVAVFAASAVFGFVIAQCIAAMDEPQAYDPDQAKRDADAELVRAMQSIAKRPRVRAGEIKG